jgi:DNA-binding MarR family transcriptional regulator
MFNPRNINEELIFIAFRISRALRKQSTQSSSNDDLSTLQLQAMLDISSEKKMTMTMLAEKLYIALPTATVLIDKLVKGKLVKRNYDSSDRRIITLALTPIGTEVLKKSLGAKLTKMNIILKNISKEDRVTLKRILSDLLDALDNQDQSEAKISSISLTK